MNIVLFSGYPYCSEHGAMNNVSKHGLWRCLVCHIGWDETVYLKDSTEGFKKQKKGENV